MGVMTKGGGGGSLRDVLLGGGGGRVGSSGGGTSRGGALTWRSLRSVSGTVDAVDPRGHFFPAKLALSLALLKLLLAILMVALGALALILQAALSSLGAGLWAGAIVGVSGFLGVCASRRPYAHVYVVSFMCVAILSMASSGLLIILSATAWARDNQHPTAVFVEQETQEEVKVLGEVLVRRPSVLVSGALVLLGVLDCMVSLACATVSAREACGLYSKGEDRAQGLSEGHNRKERLYRWLGQQKTIFPIGSSQPPPRGISSVSQFVPLSSSDSSSSATPRKTSSDPSAASSIPASSSHRTHHSTVNPSSASRTTHSSPSHISSAKGSRLTQESIPSILKPSSLPATHSSHSLPATGITNSSKHHDGHHHQQPHTHRQQGQPHGPASYPHPHPQHLHKQHSHPHQHHPHSHPHPHIMQQIPGHAYPHSHMYPQQAPMHHHFPTHASHPSLFYPHLVTPMMPHYPVEQENPQQPHQQRKHKQKKKDGKKHRDKDGKKEKKKSKKTKKELTDEQIERTYTGLDREIAEEFIDSTMEPGISIHRALNASFEQDSF